MYITILHILYTHMPSTFDINGCTILSFVYFKHPGILASCFLVKSMIKESRKTSTPKPAGVPGKFDHFELTLTTLMGIWT